MQRFLLLAVVIIITLYGSSPVTATYHEGHFEPENTSIRVPHIALLLPLESPSFEAAANAVKEGFIAATMPEQHFPFTIRLYPTTNDPLDIFVAYYQALDAGAIFIVGPLTRDGVSAIASRKTLVVPTLTLTTIENQMNLPPELYLFGLQMETEASQIAKLALASGKNHAVIIGDDSLLSRRLQSAFIERWQKEKGKTTESLQYTEDKTKLQRFRSLVTGPDHLIFLTLDATRSRALHPFLGPDIPVYATSQIFTSDNDGFLSNNELNGIQFMDMPWLLQPDHPTIMAYAHNDRTKSADMKRLYALGIDAFRLVVYLLNSSSPRDISIDGVTGRIQFAPPNQFIRKPVAAQFLNGKVQLIIHEEH